MFLSLRSYFVASQGITRNEEGTKNKEQLTKKQSGMTRSLFLRTRLGPGGACAQLGQPGKYVYSGHRNSPAETHPSKLRGVLSFDLPLQVRVTLRRLRVCGCHGRRWQHAAGEVYLMVRNYIYFQYAIDRLDVTFRGVVSPPFFFVFSYSSIIFIISWLNHLLHCDQKSLRQKYFVKLWKQLFFFLSVPPFNRELEV